MKCLDIATAAGLQPGRKSGAELLYSCPRHDDRRPSLSINDSKDLWMCGPCAQSGNAWQFAAFLANVNPDDKEGIKDWLDKHGLSNWKRPAERRIVATFQYHDEQGLFLYETVRYVPKDFRQRRPDGNGGWIWKLDDVRRVLYRLPEVLQAAEIWIAEGEKDCDNLHAIGLTTTTNPMGAGKWRETYAASFKPHQRVVILPDNDDPGKKHAQEIAASLAGKVASLRILELPDLPPKGDVSDWLKREGRENAKEELRRLAAAAREWQQSDRPESADLDVSPAIPNLSTCVRILEKDPDFKDRFYFDEFLNRIITGNPPQEWCDADDIHLTVEIQRKKKMPKMGHDTVAKAVIAVASKNKKNCAKDWLESLRWDKEPRIAHFFEDHFGAEGTAYTRAASKNFWISIVARICQPGCKADYMVILEGSQGVRKSMALETIGGPYYADSEEPVSSKDFFQSLQGKFLIEIAEMDSFSKADVTRVKAIVTRRVDRFRESYGHHAKDHPRQCIFVGTTNKDDWNRDSTGARRFWPIKCTDIDVEAIRKYREQFFAEALVRFNAGETWWEMPAKETEAEQSHRYDDDVWSEDISKFIRAKDSVTVREILLECLRFELLDISKPDQMRVADCLRRLKWFKSKKKRRVDDQVCHIWYPPDAANEAI
jgi:predicted P-loop ATPase